MNMSSDKLKTKPLPTPSDLEVYYETSFRIKGEDPPFSALTGMQKKNLRDSMGFAYWNLNEASKRFMLAVGRLVRLQNRKGK